MFVADDGNLHFVSGDQFCKAHLPIGETSLVEIVSHDLVLMSRGLEFVVSTYDGTLFCLGTGLEPHPAEWIGERMYRDYQILSWPAVTKTHNDFTFHDSKVHAY